MGIVENLAVGGDDDRAFPAREGDDDPVGGVLVEDAGKRGAVHRDVAILIAIVIYILLSKTTLGYQMKACGANRYAARYAGIRDKRNIVLTMAIAGALSAAGGALYFLSGNTEFFWNTYQSLPAEGFNGIPVALLAINNPLGVMFAAMFMSMLQICGQKLTELTAYNEYITNVIIAVIVYLAAFMLVIKTWIAKLRKGKAVSR